jgi:hypothetical protein
MVKARGYELLPDPQLKLGVDLRGFGLTKKVQPSCIYSPHILNV